MLTPGSLTMLCKVKVPMLTPPTASAAVTDTTVGMPVMLPKVRITGPAVLSVRDRQLPATSRTAESAARLRICLTIFNVLISGSATSWRKCSRCSVPAMAFSSGSDLDDPGRDEDQQLVVGLVPCAVLEQVADDRQVRQAGDAV